MAADDRSEHGDLERMLALGFPEHVGDLTGIRRSAVRERDPLERAGIDGLGSQVLHRSGPRALLGVDLDHAVSNLEHRLDREERTNEMRGAADAAAFA